MTDETQNKPLGSTPKGYSNGKHPNSLANLAKGRAKIVEKRKNGELTNPAGYSLRAELKHALDKETRAKLIQSTIQGAIKREPTPFKEVWDRVDGKVSGDEKGNTYNDIRVLIVREAPKLEPQDIVVEGEITQDIEVKE